MAEYALYFTDHLVWNGSLRGALHPARDVVSGVLHPWFTSLLQDACTAVGIRFKGVVFAGLRQNRCKIKSLYVRFVWRAVYAVVGQGCLVCCDT